MTVIEQQFRNVVSLDELETHENTVPGWCFSSINIFYIFNFIMYWHLSDLLH